MEDEVWLEWIAEVMATKPINNELLESKRGQEVVDLLLDLERNDFNWHRGDPDVFFPEIYNHSLSPEEEKEKFEEEMEIEQNYVSPYQKLDEIEKRFYENQYLFGKKVMEGAMNIVSSDKKIAIENFFNVGSHRIKFTVEEVTE